MRGLQAAAISRKLGNYVVADHLADRTLEKVTRLYQENPTNVSLALAVAQNQLFLKRYPEALETLHLGVRRAKTDEGRTQLNQAIGDAIVAWVNSLPVSSSGRIDHQLRVLRMLEVALKHAPNNPRVLTLVADHVLTAMDQDDAEVVAVRQALIDGTSAGIAHFIRGTAALLRDDIDSATTSLQLAAEHMPHSAAILNNLAVALTARDDSKLEQALKISESAIKYSDRPTPYYYETRGQILFRLGRYFDAIPDFERALRIPALAPAAHESLAECYRQIGDGELSRLHSQEAEALAKTTATTEKELPH
jgi:tetratricopeptide (TPR) repeat protein